MESDENRAPAIEAENEKEIKINFCGPPSGFGQTINEYLQHQVYIADAKAGVFLAGNIALSLVVTSKVYLHSCSLILSGVSLSLFSISALLSAIVIFPRMPKPEVGLIFWENILSFRTPESYSTALKKIGASEVEEEFSKENFYVSKVLHSKHTLLRFSIIGFLLGIAFAVPLIYLG
jgi:hypothetical protein